MTQNIHDVTGREVIHNYVGNTTLDILDLGSKRSFYKTVMSYKVEIAGISITMDNPREVFELLKEAKRNGTSKLTMVASEEPARKLEWTPDVVDSFTNLIRPLGNQRKVLLALFKASDWVTKADLMENLGLTDGQQLGGSLSGLSKNATKMGLPPVFEVERLQISGTRTSRYRLLSDLRSAIIELINFRESQKEKEAERYRESAPPLDDEDIPG
jgi:hypothetical protein